MKIIKQHDERDCGAACLSMISTYYGLKYPISKFRELTKTDQNGTNLYGLCDAANKIGLKSEALSGGLEELLDSIVKREIVFPFIAHIITEDNMQHFVVVFNIQNGKFVVGDPGKGKVKYTTEEFSRLYNGYIVTFEKTDSFNKGNYTKSSIRKFFCLLKGQYLKLASIIILSLVISIIGIAGAFVFEVILNDFYVQNETVLCEDDCGENHEHITEDSEIQPENIFDKIVLLISDNVSNFNLFFLSLIGLYLLQGGIQYSRGCLLSLISKKIDMRLILPYYSHIVELTMADVNTRNTGEYLSRFSDASAVREAVSGATLTLLLDSVMVIGCAVILYLENSKLFYISLGMILLYAVVVLCYRKPLDSINRKVMENNARVQTYLKESIDGVETVKAMQAENLVEEKHSQKFKRLLDSIFKNNIISISQDSICTTIELIGTLLIIWVGFGMVQSGMITVGSMITFYALLAYFTEPIKNLIELQPMMQTAVVAAERLNDVLDIKTENLGEENCSLEWGRIEYRNIDFRYGNHELVLKEISFDINRGEKIAIVGESGCGKTTLAKLLLKFYNAEKGEIYIDDLELSKIPITEIRKNIAYISQNTFLFSDTIKNNLMLGAEEVKDNDIEEVCKATRSNEFIDELPFGYDTFLYENGKNLSGGQRQRLAIARALLRKPKLMIFDEATSNLDTITENAIKDTIFNLDDNMTCIIIAHRLSTVKSCDRIIVIENGSIVEIGNHQELLKKKGKYFDLISRM